MQEIQATITRIMLHGNLRSLFWHFLLWKKDGLVLFDQMLLSEISPEFWDSAGLFSAQWVQDEEVRLACDGLLFCCGGDGVGVEDDDDEPVGA